MFRWISPDYVILAHVRIPIIIVLAAVACTACSASEPERAAEPTRPTADTEIANSVPSPIRDRGTLNVATDPNYPPMEFLDAGGDLTGAEIELVNAAADVMDLRSDYSIEAFSAVPSAVRTGQFDVGAASLTIRPDRALRNNAVVFAESGSQLIKSSDAQSPDPSSLCGLEVGALEGTFQIEQLLREANECRQQQLPQLKVVPFADLESATVSLSSGELGLLLTESIVSGDLLTDFPDLLTSVGSVRKTLPVAWLTAPDARKLTRTIKRALQRLIDSGYYQSVMQEYGITASSISRAEIIWAEDRQKSPNQRKGSG